MWKNDDPKSFKTEDKEARVKLNYLNLAILTLILKLTSKKIRVSVPYSKSNLVNLNHKNSLTPHSELQSDCSRKQPQPQLSPPWPQFQDDPYHQNYLINVSQKRNFKNQWKISILITYCLEIDKCWTGIKKRSNLYKSDQLNMLQKYLLIVKTSLSFKHRDI